MTGPAERLDNALPGAAIAVHTHRVVAAKAEERRAVLARRLAERMAKAAGVPVGAIHRVGRNLCVDPKRLEKQAQEDALIAKGSRAAVEIEQPTLFEATTDVSDEEWARKVRDEGYGAAVWCQGRTSCPYSDPENVALWCAGFDEFAADLAAYELTETNTRRGLASAS